jgi:hypothetical protein
VNECRNDGVGVEPQVPGFVVLQPQLDVDESVLVGDMLLGERE